MADNAWNTRADGWHDISTAPRDGRYLLLWAKGVTFFGYYQQSEYAAFTGWYADNNGDYTDGGAGQDYKCGASQYDIPTHWRPIPKAPEGV